ncbi:uncharacterized protein [Haliotis asinina]|uniref:uncharacterized protein n=1 Tax=Haliotis asinina TaxID=109174 RepID=UPI0035324B2A
MGIGILSAEIVITVIDDDEAETEEFFDLSLEYNGLIRTFPFSITDNDPVGITLNISTTTTEGDTIGFSGVQFSIPSGTVNPVDLTMAVRTITAAENTDYTVSSSSVLILYDPADPTSRESLNSFVISIIDDALFEPDKTFSIDFSSSYLLTGDVSTVITIENEDLYILTVPNPAIFVEGGIASLIYTRNSPIGELTINITSVDGTAILGIDYVIDDLSVTFPFGSASATANFTIIDDIEFEPRESFMVTASSPLLTSSVESTVLIDDNEVDTLTLTSFPASYESTSLEVTLQRSHAVADLTVQVTTTDVTTAADDFTHLSESSVTFPIGSLTASLTIDITDDHDTEGDEVFTLSISGAHFTPINATIVDNEGSRLFDCRRKGSGCSAPEDVCRPTLPLCECVGDPPREGDMCNIVTDQKTDRACRQNTCSDHGECQGDPVSPSCACFPAYYGINCQHSIFKAECTKDYMVVYANPHGDFEGAIYITDKREESDCMATSIPDPPDAGDSIDDDLRGFFVNITHASTACGAITPQEEGADIIYTRLFTIQYNQAINTGLDQIVIVTCTFNKDNLLVRDAVITNPNVGPFSNETATNTFSPVSLAADVDGSPLSSSSSIRLSKKVCVTLDVPQEFGGLEILRIAFSNSLPDSPVSWPVYTRGCQDVDAVAVLVNVPYYPQDNKRTIRFCFSAFKFVNSSRLTLEINLRVCVNAGDCDVRQCIPTRRKRQVSNEETTVEQTFNVYIPETSDPNSQTDGPGTSVSRVSDSSSCRLPFEFLPTVLCLGGIVAVLMALCVFLTFRLLHRPKAS